MVRNVSCLTAKAATQMLREHDRIYLGFDPGGKDNFGVALLDGNRVKTSVVNTVDPAMSGQSLCAKDESQKRRGSTHCCIGQLARAVCAHAISYFALSILI